MTARGQAPLVLVSNRGPVTFDVDGSFTRGTGGLVAGGHRADWIDEQLADIRAKHAAMTTR